MADSSNKATTASPETTQLMQSLLGQDQIEIARGQQSIEQGKLKLAQEQLRVQQHQFKIQAEQEKNRLQSQEGMAKDQMAAQMMQTAAEREQMDNWDRRRGQRELEMFERTMTEQREMQRIRREQELADIKDQRLYEATLEDLRARDAREQTYTMQLLGSRFMTRQKALENVVSTVTDYAEEGLLEEQYEQQVGAAIREGIQYQVGDLYLNWDRIMLPSNERRVIDQVWAAGMAPINAFFSNEVGLNLDRNSVSAVDAAFISGVVQENEDGTYTTDYARFRDFTEQTDRSRGFFRRLAPGDLEQRGRKQAREVAPLTYAREGTKIFGGKREGREMPKHLSRAMANIDFLQGFADGKFSGANVQPEERDLLMGVMEAVDDLESGRIGEDQFKEILSDPDMNEIGHLYVIMMRERVNGLIAARQGDVPPGVSPKEWRKRLDDMPEDLRETFEAGIDTQIEALRSAIGKLETAGVRTGSEEVRGAAEGALEFLRDEIADGNFDPNQVLAHPKMKRLATTNPETYASLERSLRNVSTVAPEQFLEEVYADAPEDTFTNMVREFYGE